MHTRIDPSMHMIFMMVNKICYAYVVYYVSWNFCKCHIAIDASCLWYCDIWFIWDMTCEGSNGILDYDCCSILSWKPYERALWLMCGGRFFGPRPHKGLRILDVGGIRLEEEGCRLTGEIRWILYHSTIMCVITVST